MTEVAGNDAGHESSARLPALVIAVTAGIALGGWLASTVFGYCAETPGGGCREVGFWDAGRLLQAAGGIAVLGTVAVAALVLSRRSRDGSRGTYAAALAYAIVLTGVAIVGFLFVFPLLWAACGWVLFAAIARARKQVPETGHPGG